MVEMKFEDLPISPELKRGIADLEFTEMFPIQERAIPRLLDSKDVVGQAKTGSGKTCAFGLPLIQKLDWKSRYVQGLILVPTRELCVQVASDLTKYAKYTPIRATAIYGGVDIEKQFRELRSGVQVVVGTPGRVIDHLKRGTLLLDRLSVLVLDEADRMLDMGFIDDIEYILRQTPRRKQVSLWSATIDERTRFLSRRYMQNPEMILISKDEIAVEEIDQRYIRVAAYEKLEILEKLIRHLGIDRAMIFCQMRETVDELTQQLKKDGFEVEAIHGQLSQARREQVLDAFRNWRLSLMVATEVAARGLDIEDVSFIINYEVPSDPLMYFHRIGRTARAGKSGVAITLVSFEEEDALKGIQSLTSTAIKKMILPPDFLL